MGKVAVLLQVLKNMGWRYTSYRIGHEVKKRLGHFERAFPTTPPIKQYISLAAWKELPAQFFFNGKPDISRRNLVDLKIEFEAFQNGHLKMFNSDYHKLGINYDWITHNITGYKYDITTHWSKINDFSDEAGDIKYVWEKSRFSFLHLLIRYDQHFQVDQSELVFSQIDSWIAANPINCGPNWKCSQEISLRTMNWLFALYYYKDSAALTEERFQKIMHVCYWQLKHVREHINFSRIAVRNNHAITETLMLHLSGIFFPFFPEAAQWQKQGQQWLDQELLYQIYPDGTFLQFSHNYHRVLIQLLSWYFNLSALNEKPIADKIYSRAYASLSYLSTCVFGENGELPNYGANDGALFFKLTHAGYRDYRPQLNALHYFLTGRNQYNSNYWEETEWYGTRQSLSKNYEPVKLETLGSFKDGGYYIIREKTASTFLRCGNHKDRPSQADNLHLDIWINGRNILRDAGSYMYNTKPEFVNYFFGTASHNTVMLGDHHQMLKGPRFIWLNWTQSEGARLDESDDHFVFEGKIYAFGHINKGIQHHRKVIKHKDRPTWLVEDRITEKGQLPLRQIWNLSSWPQEKLTIEAQDETGKPIIPTVHAGAYSGEYGKLEGSVQIIFETKRDFIVTSIVYAH